MRDRPYKSFGNPPFRLRWPIFTPFGWYLIVCWSLVGWGLWKLFYS